MIAPEITQADREAGGVGPSADIPWLHIRSQFTYHAEASITGTRVGLLALRAAVDEALLAGHAEVEVFASDGEGYGVLVRRTSTIAGLGRPTYLDEEARSLAAHEREFMVRMSKLERKQAKEALDALRWCRKHGNPHARHPTQEQG